MQRLGRMKHEVAMLKSTPLAGITAWCVDDSLDHLQANIVGGSDTPYRGGVFKLDVRVPARYPFEPPHVKFLTPIYHPNVDAGGRICLDVLKMPPKGEWRPSSNIKTVLLSIQLLMNEPNPDDPLMEEISAEYKTDREKFNANAASWTRRHASQNGAASEETSATAARNAASANDVHSSKKLSTSKGVAEVFGVKRFPSSKDASKDSIEPAANPSVEPSTASTTNPAAAAASAAAAVDPFDDSDIDLFDFDDDDEFEDRDFESPRAKKQRTTSGNVLT